MTEQTADIAGEQVRYDESPDTPQSEATKTAESAKPNAHLVLIVHGIGEQVAGHTVDQIVAGALAAHPDRPRSDWSDSGVEVRSSHLSLTEKDFESAPDVDIQKTFACHTCAIVPNDTDKHKCVLSEVHWSDLSPAPKGAFATIFDLIQLVLGLGYIAMDNVENIHKSLPPRGAIHAFNWIFYGGIAVINGMLLVGILLLTLRSYFPEVDYILVVFGNAILGLCLWQYLHAKREQVPRFLVTVFRRGTFLWSSVTLVFLIWLVTFPHHFNRKFVTAWEFASEFKTFSFIKDRAETCESYVTEAYSTLMKTGVRPEFGFDSASCFVEINLLTVGFLWVGAAFLTAISQLGYLHKDRKQVIYPAICSAMLIFWSLIASGFWLAIRQIFDQFDLSEDDCEPSILGKVSAELEIELPSSELNDIYVLFCNHLDKVLGTLTLAALTLVVLVFMGLFLQHRGTRVIIHKSLRIVLALFPVLLLCLLVGETSESETLWTRIGTVVVAAVLGAAILVYNFNEIVANVLGVARDVIVYLRRDKCFWRAKPDQRETNYPYREQIEARFDRVFWVMLNVVKPHRVTIISHSQGTVIAARKLKDLMSKLSQTHPKLSKNVLFITMGSPISHIYGEYFPQNYDIKRKNIARKFKWHNLYRDQDFVGKKIYTVELDPECDHAVGPGGHSNYFSDRRVWSILWGKVGFRLFTDP